MRRPVSTSVSSPGRLTRGEGAGGNREVPLKNRPLEEGGPWGKHGFPHGSEPKASDVHAAVSSSLCSASTPIFFVLSGFLLFELTGDKTYREFADPEALKASGNLKLA